MKRQRLKCYTVIDRQVQKMRITVLTEDKAPSDNRLFYEHGLSLYCESRGYRFLFDMGQSDVFIKNAALLGIDLQSVDFAVISHAHDDHGGGLTHFLDLNTKAVIYASRHITGEFYMQRFCRKEYAGLSPDIFKKHQQRFVFLDHSAEVVPGFEVLTNLNRYFAVPAFCRLMKEKKDGRMESDLLLHEIILAVKEEDGVKVLTGCSHHGVNNILANAIKEYGRISAFVGGFHMAGTKYAGTGLRLYAESPGKIKKTCLQLGGIPDVYTGHCTGERAFGILQKCCNAQYLTVGQTFML